MPRPAPRTVPVKRPITKLPPPPPSLSKRSYPSAMSPPQKFSVLSSKFSSSRSRLKHRFHRDAQSTNEADDAARFLTHVRSHAIRGVVHATDRAVNRLIDAFGFFPDPLRHNLHVVENRVDPADCRRDLPRLEAVDQIHHAFVDHEARDPQADESEGFEDADRGHDPEQQIR